MNQQQTKEYYKDLVKWETKKPLPINLRRGFIFLFINL